MFHVKRKREGIFQSGNVVLEGNNQTDEETRGNKDGCGDKPVELEEFHNGDTTAGKAKTDTDEELDQEGDDDI